MSSTSKKTWYILDFARSRIHDVAADPTWDRDKVLKDWVDTEHFYNGFRCGAYAIVSGDDITVFDISTANVPVIKQREGVQKS
jgi:hypothetical protein